MDAVEDTTVTVVQEPAVIDTVMDQGQVDWTRSSSSEEDSFDEQDDDPFWSPELHRRFHLGSDTTASLPPSNAVGSHDSLEKALASRFANRLDLSDNKFSSSALTTLKATERHTDRCVKCV